jgi:hypothetical protein
MLSDGADAFDRSLTAHHHSESETEVQLLGLVSTEFQLFL